MANVTTCEHCGIDLHDRKWEEPAQSPPGTEQHVHTVERCRDRLRLRVLHLDNYDVEGAEQRGRTAALAEAVQCAVDARVEGIGPGEYASGFRRGAENAEKRIRALLEKETHR
jgi:hypothetical protein